MEDRRQGSRRQGERREFRNSGGRRSAQERGRRRAFRPFLIPLLAVSLPLLVGGVYRWKVVTPREAVEVATGQYGKQVREILGQTSLPGLAFPGASEPLAGLPWTGPIPLTDDQRSQLETSCSVLEIHLDETHRVPAVGRVAGVCFFLLGDDSRARRSWDGVVVHGALVQRAEAQVGLALIALRQGLGAESAQDRAFALDRALQLLESAEQIPAVAEVARFNREAILRLSGGAPPG
ncbi:MAG: hypothetical protein VX498_04480 [Myxococcota bacterium]|nr:hypothetical protein [Myxococcota bacterium]